MATPEVSQLPREWSDGKKTALDSLTPVGYEEVIYYEDGIESDVVVGSWNQHFVLWLPK